MNLVIIGNGVAGITTAKTVRELQPDWNIRVYSREGHPYYFRPKLPDLLGGMVTPQEIYVYSDEWYQKRSIEVHLNAEVSAISPSTREIVLGDGSKIPYGRLCIAAGSHSFVPPIQGVDTSGVFTLRTVDDALGIKEFARACKKAIVIGGGLLGLEASRALKSLGLEVAVVEFFPRLLPRQLDEEGASLLKTKIEEMGIKVHLNSVTEEIFGDDEVEGVVLNDGRRIDGDLVLISAGVRANLDLARSAGLPADKGILVDERMKTGIEGIYAAGDVVEFRGTLWGIIPAAVDQAKVAAATIAGSEGATYEGTVPYTTLKVVGVDLTSIGNVNPEGDGFKEIRRAKPKEGIYKKLVLKDGRIVGAIFLGDRKDVTPVNKLISGEVNIAKQADHLLSEDFDLNILVP